MFEVSVVSVPCNQAATFSLAKSFDSLAEYEEFKKTFINSVELAEPSLAKDEKSLLASDAPDGANAQKETNMSEGINTPEVDLEAFAKKVAEETAAKIAMKQAEQKAAEVKAVQEAEEKAAADAEAKNLQAEEVKSAIQTGVESGPKSFLAICKKSFLLKTQIWVKSLLSIRRILKRNLKRSRRCVNLSEYLLIVLNNLTVTKWGQDFLKAHMLGVMTQKVGILSFAQIFSRKPVLTMQLMLVILTKKFLV